MFLKIRNKFLVPMVVLVLLGMSFSSFIYYETAKNTLEKSKISQLAQAVDNTNHSIKDWLSNRKIDVANWSKQDILKTALKNNFLGKAARKNLNADFARMQNEYQYYSGFHLAASTGIVVASSNPKIVDSLNIKDRTYFKTALNGKENMSSVLKSKTDGSPIFIIAAPVVDRDRVIGVFYVLIHLQNFNAAFIDRIKIGETGYAFMVDRDGTTLAHPNKNDIMNKRITDFDFGSEMMAAPDGILRYRSNGVDKLAALQTLEETGWKIVISTHMDEAYAAINKLAKLSLILVASIVSIAAVIILLVANSVTKPINMVVEGLRDAAEGEGDLTKRLAVGSRDEVGELASCFNTFVEKVHRIISDIHSNIATLNVSAGSLSDLSDNLSAGSEDSSHRSNTVAAAAEEMDANMKSVAAACEQASENVNVVAATTEEMNSTVSEIAGNTGKAREVTEDAVDKTSATFQRMTELGAAAREISKVTETITDISEQTNLLALNATIEAARAGEAGKGFAVVANEIKELAKQTAQATLEIRQRIDAIQSSTSTTLTEMEQINTVINDVNSIVTTIASAVEEQAVSTNEIASNVAQAARGIAEVNENVAQSSLVAGEISMEIAEVSQVAGKISQDSGKVNGQSRELLTLSDQLEKAINQFKLQ
ncbi:MAG: chemotaxis protein [Deltaproteobacteria bacterium]|nr:MAG: chemotaxis protein [Deltaproteobacteria bacterium]